MRQDIHTTLSHGSNLRRRELLKASALGAAIVALPMGASAQAAPLRIVVPYVPGGSADIVGRIVARWLAERTGRTVIVDNKGGAGGTVGTSFVVNAPPDGNTLLMHTGTIAVEAAAGKKLPYDARKQLAPVGMVAAGPFALLVNPELPVHSVAELIAYCKANPGKLNYASSGIGTSVHLAMELFKSMAGIEVTHIPYKGGSPSVSAVVAGEAQMMINPLATAKPFSQTGRVRALAVSVKKQTDLWPELPTMDASGVPGYNTSVWYGLSATAGTPPEVMAKLSADLRAVVAVPASKAWLVTQGLDAVGDTPEEFRNKIDQEVQIWAALIKKSGLSLE